MRKILIAILLLPLIASGEVLDKSSSFSVEQDSVTGVWTLECTSEVSGIDRLETYNADIFVTGRALILDVSVELLPSEKSFSDFVEGLYEIEVKKVGHKLMVNIDATQLSAITGDSFECVINIAKGPFPPAPGAMLYAMQILHRITSSGEP